MLEIARAPALYEMPQTRLQTLASGYMNHTAARDSFWIYRKLIDPTFVEGWWQEDAAYWLTRFYQDIEAGKRPKLVMQAPPQHGKSRMVTDFVTWMAGKNPDLNTIFTSYSDELGTTANLRFQRILELPVYRKVWWNTRLASGEFEGRWQRNTSVCEYVDYKGSFRTTTVNGQITGHGLDIGVVDDPIKGRAEASSKTIRDKTWNWLVDDFFSRFADHAGLLMIMTRWHVDDPVGRWIERFPETKVLRYRAVATDPNDWSVREGYRNVGEALFSQLKPLEFLAERRKLSTAASWESLYQQTPIITGGGVFPIDRYKVIQSVDRSNVKKSVRYVDKAATADGGAYTAFVLMHQMRDDTYVVEDVRRGQWSALDRERRLLQTVQSDAKFCQPYSVYIEQEPGSGGKESAEASVRMLKGFRAYADRVTGSKEVRAHPYAAQVQNGSVSLVAGAWNMDFLDEHEVWPNGKYKDQVDAASGAFNKLASASNYDSSYRGWR
jgi:predicted phage terminase large subunit-like protein